MITAVAPDDCEAPPELCAYPEFDLSCRLDDLEDPASVTVYPAGADETVPVTAWLTIDVEHAVLLEDAR